MMNRSKILGDDHLDEVIEETVKSNVWIDFTKIKNWNHYVMSIK